jgi:hypothetical protein
MKISDISKTSQKRLTEDLSKDESGFLTEDLVKIVQAHQADNWSEPIDGEDYLQLLKQGKLTWQR